MTTEYPYATLRRYERTVAGLMADPEVTGELLLVGLWLARATVLFAPPPGENGWDIADMARDLFPMQTTRPVHFMGEQHGEQATGPDLWHVVGVLKKDIRRYDVWADNPGPRGGMGRCSGPMVRKPTCSKPAAACSTFLTDPATGRRRQFGACRKHEQWFWEQCRANKAALEGVDVPRPPANAGGCLVPHIDIDWPELYVGLDPQWVPPPEVDSWARPALKLLVTHTAPIHPPSPERPRKSRRPRFAVISGGADPDGAA